jgi:hypothetical protein
MDNEGFGGLPSGSIESRFIPLALSAGLPMPLTGQWVSAFKVDFYWPDLRLIVETDGFTRAQVWYEPDHVRATLAKVVRRLAAALRTQPRLDPADT